MPLAVWGHNDCRFEALLDIVQEAKIEGNPRLGQLSKRESERVVDGCYFWNPDGSISGPKFMPPPNSPACLVTMSSGRTFPLLPSGAPVQLCTTPPPHTTQGHLSSPVKSVVQPFAAHKREEVQNYGYDKSLHQLKDYETPEAFLKFLRVSEDLLEASAKDTTPGGSGKSSGKSKGKSTASDGKAIEESTDFSRKNFVRAANALAESMKNKCAYFLALPLIFRVDLSS